MVSEPFLLENLYAPNLSCHFEHRATEETFAALHRYFGRMRK